jgi:hypothetical protein
VKRPTSGKIRKGRRRIRRKNGELEGKRRRMGERASGEGEKGKLCGDLVRKRGREEGKRGKELRREK